MRYYKIQIFSPEGELKEEWSSHRENGLVNNGALRVEFTLPIAVMTESAGNAEVKIWGVPMSYLAQSYNLNGYSVYIEAGMMPGLPLANPNQKGIILKGRIQATYSLWEATNAYLQFNIVAGSNPLTDPRDLIVNWKKGVSLADTLSEVLKEYPLEINIKDNLIVNFNHCGYYPNYAALAAFIKQYSEGFIKDANYQGVRIARQNDKFIVFDGSKPADKIVKIDFKDFIGQPQWLNINQVTFTVILRGDLKLGCLVEMPERLISQYAFNSGIFNEREKLNFKGKFQIVSITHIGDFRNPTPDAWSTIIIANKNVTE